MKPEGSPGRRKFLRSTLYQEISAKPRLSGQAVISGKRRHHHSTFPFLYLHFLLDTVTLPPLCIPYFYIQPIWATLTRYLSGNLVYTKNTNLEPGNTIHHGCRYRLLRHLGRPAHSHRAGDQEGLSQDGYCPSPRFVHLYIKRSIPFL